MCPQPMLLLNFDILPAWWFGDGGLEDLLERITFMNEGMMTGRRINRFPGFIHAEFAQGNRRRKKNPAFTTPASEEGGEDCDQIGRASCRERV